MIRIFDAATLEKNLDILFLGNSCSRYDFECIEDKWSIDAEVREFSKTNVHTPDGRSRLDIDSKNIRNETNPSVPFYKTIRRASIYPNGCNSSTEGQVSLEFDVLTAFLLKDIRSVEMACSVVVVDKEGCRRFPQSFVIREEIKSAKQKSTKFFIHNYITRDFLRRAADELLPEDTLTVQMDGVIKLYIGDPEMDDTRPCGVRLGRSVKTEEEVCDGKSTRCHYLLLDSEVEELLRREAKYFERLYVTPMAEKNLGCVRISDEEFETFKRTVKILWPTESEHTFTLQEIFDVYAFADYYGIEYVLETCRRWLKLVCRTSDHASEVFRLADWYIDTLLHGIADGILAMIEKEIDGYDLGGPYPGEPDEEWEYTPVDHKTMSPHVSQAFTFLRRRKFKETEDVPDISNSYI